jgi:antitoxin (DNA-binding transcriptional repressor) of toxin-antitoxin stability system
LRRSTGEHLARVAEGAIETITQNGSAVLIVMSPERYDAIVLEVERGRGWDRGLGSKAGEGGNSSPELVRL